MDLLKNILDVYIEAGFEFLDNVNSGLFIVGVIAWLICLTYFLPMWVTYLTFALLIPHFSVLVAVLCVGLQEVFRVEKG